jgi:glycerol-3-phosphate dehydrogenase subunit B
VSYDTVVIGAGLAGLTAALRLADEGAKVLVIAKGVGSTHLSPATIDVLGFDAGGRVESPAQALPAFTAANPDHPYARLSPQLVAASVEWLKARLPAMGYQGSVEENFLLPTAVGAVKPSALVPEAMAAGDLRAGGRFVLVGLGLKDFYPAYLADNLAQAGLDGQVVSARAIEVSPPVAGAPDRSSPGYARLLEERSFRDALVRELTGKLEPDERVGFPAVLGHLRAGEVWRELEARLERPVFEVATLPPSLSGIRLYEAMSAALRDAGSRIHVGEPVVAAETADGRIEAVITKPTARATTYRGDSFVLATGGFASGGLQVDSFGAVSESVFSLPVGDAPAANEPRFLPDYLAEHPVNRVGVAVDDRLRPIAASGEPVYENLHASGATLAGALPWREASGNGLSLATGYAAAAAILEVAS